MTRAHGTVGGGAGGQITVCRNAREFRLEFADSVDSWVAKWELLGEFSERSEIG